MRAKHAASRRGTAAVAPPNIPTVVSPSTAPAPQPSAQAASTAALGSAYISSGSVASTPASGTSTPWFLDSGASFHMTSNES